MISKIKLKFYRIPDDITLMNKTKATFLLFSIFLQMGSIASEDNYRSIKGDIDNYEDSVIRDFKFSIPKDYVKKFDSNLQISLNLELEEAFNNQIKLFQNAETGLFKIGQSLQVKVQNSELTEKEQDKLMTNVEYARRIILHTRKQEVYNQYAEYKKQLSVKPTIEHLFNKISKARLPGSCKIQDVHLEGNFLSFEISGLNPDGVKLAKNYVISKTDVDLGSLTTKPDARGGLNVGHKSILSFRSTENDLSLKQFQLFENQDGEFYHAEFIHEDIKEPWINFLGISIGETTTSEEIFCNLAGTSPASIEELQRDKIRKNFESTVSQN